MSRSFILRHGRRRAAPGRIVRHRRAGLLPGRRGSFCAFLHIPAMPACNNGRITALIAHYCSRLRTNKPLRHKVCRHLCCFCSSSLIAFFSLIIFVYLSGNQGKSRLSGSCRVHCPPFLHGIRGHMEAAAKMAVMIPVSRDTGIVPPSRFPGRSAAPSLPG